MLSVFKQVYAYREMLRTTVKKDLRARYKGSILGFFWTFLNPVLQLLVYSLVFSVIVRVSIPGYNYTLFLFVGLVPWNYFSTTCIQSTMVVVVNGNLVKKIFFPRILLPLSTTVTNLVNMLLSMIIVFASLWLMGVGISTYYVYLPFIILAQTFVVFGFSLLLSSLTVYFRDLEHITGIIIMAWLYVSPILFPADNIPGPLFSALKYNPLMPIMTSYQNTLLFNSPPDFAGIWYATAFGLALCIFGYIVFEGMQRRFAEEL